MEKYSYSLKVLSNNLRVLYLPFATETVYVSLLGKAGRRAEKNSEIGVAHFLEHLFFDGTKKRPSALELNKFIDEQGSGHNGWTRADTVEYAVKILSQKVEFAFDYLSDIVLNSLLRDKDIEKERKVIKEESLMKKDSPESFLERRCKSLLYPNQAIGRGLFDEEKNLENINDNVLREFIKRNYVAQNFLLTVSGNISEEKALSLAEKYFSGFPQGTEIKFEEAKIEKEKKIEIIRKDLNQAKFSINFKGFPLASIESTRAAVLSRILTFGFSSRLYDCLRTKKHLVYSVRSGTETYPDTGIFFINSSTSEEKLQDSVSQIFKEVNQLLNEGVSDDELEKAKNISLFLILSEIEKIENYVALFFRQALFKERIKGLKERLKEISDMTKEDVTETAKYIFSDEPKIGVLAKTIKELEVNNKL